MTRRSALSAWCIRELSALAAIRETEGSGNAWFGRTNGAGSSKSFLQ